MLNKNLYVRVKRSREDEPAESMYIVEDAAPAKKRSIKSLNTQLSDPAPAVAQPRSLLLSRVRTLHTADDSLLLGSPNDAESEDGSEQPPRKRRVAAKIVVTSGSKTVLSESTGPCMVIDMAQVVSKPQIPVSRVAPVAAPVPVSRILDPATRLLDRGIQTAVKIGDFNDISAALMQGANADHQTATGSSGAAGGFTALMAACLHCNIRMVKRLVMKGVDTLKTNAEGKCALDLLVTTPRNKGDAAEIRSLLQSAMMKATAEQSGRQVADQELSLAGHHSGSSNEADYVYDIYCVHDNSQGAAAEPIEDATMVTEKPISPPAPATVTDGAEEAVPISIVRVEGLRILDQDHIELVMAYDSDWSDLGDDEDPDSNDERFHGNDYPEDEENDGFELQDSDDDAYTPHARAKGRTAQHAQGPSQARFPARLGLPQGTRVGSFLPSASAATATAPGGKQRVRFYPDGVDDVDADLNDLIRQEEEAQGGDDDSEGGDMSNDDAAAEEAALYRELSGGDYYHDGDVEGDGEGENSDYDFDADEAAMREDDNGQAQQCGLGAGACGGGGGGGAGTGSARRTRRAGKSRPAPGGPVRRCVLPSTEQLLCDDDANLPDFERRLGIGKVLRPQILMDSHVSEEDAFSQRGLYEEPHTTETLQELWGETEGNREDYRQGEAGQGGGGRGGGLGRGSAGRGGGKEHADRLEHMRQRTGMVFAASAKEFDPHTGLAKYGAELSDDDADGDVDGRCTVVRTVPAPADAEFGSSMVGQRLSLLQYRSERPPQDTVAYDSELDASD